MSQLPAAQNPLLAMLFASAAGPAWAAQAGQPAWANPFGGQMLNKRPQPAPAPKPAPRQSRPAPVAPQGRGNVKGDLFANGASNPTGNLSYSTFDRFINPFSQNHWYNQSMMNPNQGGNEGDARYGVRQMLAAPARMAGQVASDVGSAITRAFDTPNARAAAAARPGPIAGAQNGLAAAVYQAAQQLGTTPEDLMTVISYETGGTFDPSKRGGKNNNHLGLIQFGLEEQRKYGIKPGMTVEQQMPAVVQFLKDRGFKPGMDIKDLYSTINAGTPGRYNASDGNGTVASHVEKMLGEHGPQALRMLGSSVGGALVNPFLAGNGPAYANAGFQQINAAEAAALRPFSTEWNQGAAPTMPEMQKLPTTDFSKADAALEALRPVEQDEKDKLRIEREGFFGGIAKAMMSANPNDGFGTFLMRMGGAALGGRMAAKEEIRERHDKFEEKMARFNAAVYQNETNKATTLGAELKAQVQQDNQFALSKWQQSFQQWQQNNTVDISGTNVVRRSIDPTTGKGTVNIIPIASAVQSAFALQRAQQYAQVGSQAVQGASVVASAQNSLVTGVAANAMQMAMTPGANGVQPGEAEAAAAAAPAFYASHAVRMGRAPELLGEQPYKDLQANVTARTKAMMSSGMLKPEDVAETSQRMMAEEIARIGLADPGFMQKLANAGAGADMDIAVQRTYGARTRTSTDARGRTTRTTTAGAEVEGM